jgi:hypothetical protein
MRVINLTLTLSDDWEDFNRLDGEDLMEELLGPSNDLETIEVLINSDKIT